MRPSLTFQIKPDLPESLAPLAEIAANLWFSWHAGAIDLMQRVDHHLWREVNHNPVALLNQISQERLETLAEDSGFLAQMDRVVETMRAYLGATKCAFLNGRAPEGLKIAYFSAEYGLTDCLSLYSGGLGVLSGDHLKSASDLNLPLVAVGLAYGQGYFNQYLNADGWQQEEYHPNDFYNLPMSLMTTDDGNELRISVDIEGGRCRPGFGAYRWGECPCTSWTPTSKTTRRSCAPSPSSSTAATARCASARRFSWASAGCACSRPSISNPTSFT